MDFIGLNHYTCEVVASEKSGVPDGINPINWSRSKTQSFSADEENYHYHDPKWPGSQTWWLKVTPNALRLLLNYIKTEYGNPEVIITENGYPDKVEVIEDVQRSNYYEAYINETLKAVKLDGCNVTGYMAWGLLDGWEWTTGHEYVFIMFLVFERFDYLCLLWNCRVTFGVHHVDMKNPDRPRTPRLSARTLKRIFESHGFLQK